MIKEKFDFYDKTVLKSYDLDSSARYQLKMLDSLDNFTRKHSEGVANITCRICDYLHLNKDFTTYCTTCAYLHDIGKMFIPPSILQKPSRLTDEEYEIMKEHTVIGEKMLKSLELYQDEPLVKTACEIGRWHHERYDGKGYPDGLKGDEIPISAQIVSIADVYDELVSERVYKKAFSHEKAMEMILNGECGAFNPLLLECLVEIQDRIKTELDGSGSVKKETYKKTIQEIERDMNINTL